MLEVSRVGVAESDEEIELSLELSIGGSYGKCEKAKQVVGSSCKNDERVVKNVVPRSGFSFSEADSGSGSEAVDPNRKREIQALRRREARRKREEKLRKSAVNFKGMNDKQCVEAQALQLQSRAQYREMREKDSLVDNEPARKKDKILVASCLTNEAVEDSPNLTLQHDQTGNIDQGSEKKAATSSCQQNVGMLQMHGLYPQSQCMSLKNGSMYPYGAPCLGPGVVGKEGNGLKEKAMFQPVACGSFRPYLHGNGDMNTRHNSGTGCDSGQHSGMSRIVNQKAMSNGSLERSSSAISDFRSTSMKDKGGSISDTGSHSSCLQTNERQLSVSATSDALNQPESNGSLNKREAGKDTLRVANSPMRTSLPKEGQYSSVDAARNSEPDIKSNAATSKLKDTSSSPLKQSSELLDNPSKIQSQNLGKPSLPRMPCVSTTGNGPNGKTITGFLYRYTKTEISIVCVCHGSSFSPAEFVEHAGGIDITHPLRHITMVPSSFG